MLASCVPFALAFIRKKEHQNRITYEDFAAHIRSHLMVTNRRRSFHLSPPPPPPPPGYSCTTISNACPVHLCRSTTTKQTSLICSTKQLQLRSIVILNHSRSSAPRAFASGYFRGSPGAEQQCRKLSIAGMDSAAKMHDMYETMLENILQDPTEPPVPLPFEFLRAITHDFSNEYEIGRGGFSVVYKGILRSGKVIAVKKLYDRYQEVNSFDELSRVMGITHPNVVQLIGYCAETKMDTVTDDSGKLVMTEVRSRILCFEYLSNGGLDKYISKEHLDHGWDKIYTIIKGICGGLRCLHEEKVVHLDLKPQNILMDCNMVPKIVDFGLARFLGEKNSKIYTERATGTVGYMAPEYFIDGEITPKADIFSMGVIMIELITGSRNYPRLEPYYSYTSYNHNSADSTPEQLQQFTQNVLGTWRKIFEKQLHDASVVELYTHQLTNLVKISLKCLDSDITKRPNAADILRFLYLNETGGSPCNSIYKYGKVKYGSPLAGPSSTFYHRHMGNSLMHDMYETMLENILQDPSQSPVSLPLEFLKAITDNFSKDYELGRGGYGVVYKGILQSSKIIAVKKIRDCHLIDEKNFLHELGHVTGIIHTNVVHLIGYCAETKMDTVTTDRGELVAAEKRSRLLCFEYLNNGGLEKYISKEHLDLGWDNIFAVIKGICSGLNALHEEKIVHRDLKPQNILLDGNMVPKIVDFGLARLLGENSKVYTKTTTGTFGYMAPEYISQGQISAKADIYSLGIIMIELITGSRKNPQSMAQYYSYTSYENNDPNCIQAQIQQFTRNVLGTWRKIFKDKLNDASLVEIYSRQVKELIDIAQKCLDDDRNRRPNASDILQLLSDIETGGSSCDPNRKYSQSPAHTCFFLAVVTSCLAFCRPARRR